MLRDIGARALRNALQTMLPLLALASAGRIDGASAAAVCAAAGIAAIVSVLKSASGLQADPAAPLATQLLERALAAAAGSALALVPLDLTGVLSADWVAIGTAVVGAAALSLASWSLDHLPADQAGQVDLQVTQHRIGDR
jgi:hypothetical protein